jgi:predicted dehydrogenase
MASLGFLGQASHPNRSSRETADTRISRSSVRWIHKPGIEHGQRAPRYTLQGDAFSRAVLGQAPIEDAIANMRVIDAAFRSAKSGGWEKP